MTREHIPQPDFESARSAEIQSAVDAYLNEGGSLSRAALFLLRTLTYTKEEATAPRRLAVRYREQGMSMTTAKAHIGKALRELAESQDLPFRVRAKGQTGNRGYWLEQASPDERKPTPAAPVQPSVAPTPSANLPEAAALQSDEKKLDRVSQRLARLRPVSHAIMAGDEFGLAIPRQSEDGTWRAEPFVRVDHVRDDESYKRIGSFLSELAADEDFRHTVVPEKESERTFIITSPLEK